MVFSKVGPNQSIEWGQIRVSKSAVGFALEGFVPGRPGLSGAWVGFEGSGVYDGPGVGKTEGRDSYPRNSLEVV